MWRLQARRESAERYVTDPPRGLVTEAWTADRAGRMRQGDVVLLYATAPIQAYVAVGRVCHEPVQNWRARRLKKNRDWWTFIELMALSAPISRSDVEDLEGAGDPGSGLGPPRQSRAYRIAHEMHDAVLALLRDRDVSAFTQLQHWLDSTPAYPPHLDVGDLEHAVWRPSEARPVEELELAKAICKRLVRTGSYRLLEEGDVSGPGLTQASRLRSVEHYLGRAEGGRRIDILLRDARSSDPTLLLVEVKTHASLAPGRDPVRQVLDYRACLTRREPGIAIRVAVVAKTFSPGVVENAIAADVPYRVCSSSGKLNKAL